MQQDDILLETFTPEESFRFAAKLRTALNPYEIEDKIRAAHGLDFDAPPPVSEEDVVEK